MHQLISVYKLIVVDGPCIPGIIMRSLLTESQLSGFFSNFQSTMKLPLSVTTGPWYKISDKFDMKIYVMVLTDGYKSKSSE